MGQPAAKMNDQVVTVKPDIHIIMIPAPPAPPVPTPIPHPYVGMITGGCSMDVKIMGQPAATKDSETMCVPPHIPQGGPFQKPPDMKGTVLMGSFTVKINGKMAARMGDPVATCDDITPPPANMNCKIIAVSTVMIG